MYKIYVRKTIESGLADSDAGRVTDVEKVREEFGLPSKPHFEKPSAKRLHKDP